MNPYEPTKSTLPNGPASDPALSEKFGPFVISAFLFLAVLVSLLSLAAPWIRPAIRPRFGSVGLITCAFPLMVLVRWFWNPERTRLAASAFMLFATGLINAWLLIRTGTVSKVANEFTDRLHSSWLWCVLPFILAGIFLSWRATIAKPRSFKFGN